MPLSAVPSRSLPRACACAFAALVLAAPVGAQIDLGRAIGAAVDLGKAATLSDDDVKNYARQMRAYEERAREQVAPPGSPYAKRLAALTDRYRNYDGLALNFKVYQSKQVNANASADGSIRVYTGLMDLMTDAELLFVIGHEIGHVKGGHSAKAMRTALATRGLRNAAMAASNSSAVLIADAQFGGLIEGVVNAQHSQAQEIQSDDYGLAFMKANNIPPAAAESALRKLAGLSKGSATILSSHPDPGKRADRMAKAR